MEKNQMNQELPESIQTVEKSVKEIISSFMPEGNEDDKSILVIVAEKGEKTTSSLNIIQGTNNLLYSSVRALLKRDDNLFEIISEAVKDARIDRLIEGVASILAKSGSEDETSKGQEDE